MKLLACPLTLELVEHFSSFEYCFLVAARGDG